MTTFHVCKDICINDYDDFEDFIDDVLNSNREDDPELLLEDVPFCYLSVLKGINLVPEKFIPVVLEAAMYFAEASSDETILMVSVTSKEEHYKEWLEQAENYPGSTITAVVRGGWNSPERTVYTLLFPSLANN